MEIGTLEIGRLGVWTFLDALPAEEAVRCARRIEELGYSALWLPETVGRDPFSFIGFLAARTERLVLATGIANVYARDAVSLRAVRETLGEASGGRFVLGLGVSHHHLVSKVRGHDYAKPVTTMRATLDAIEGAIYRGPSAEPPAPIVLAALGEKMLRLAGERTRGAHPYLVPPEHTAKARSILGPEPWLCPEQMVLLESDPSRARAVAREQLSIYIRLPNYQRTLREYGFGDADFADGGSDRLVDTLVAWGSEDDLRARIEAHYRAGADHVCIQPFRPDGGLGPDWRTLEILAPGRG